MKTNYRIVRIIDALTGKLCVGSSKLYRDPIVEVGRSCRLNLSVDIKLTEEQIKRIEEQTKTEIDNAISFGRLDSYIKETVKAVIKSIVNEEIQTKNYRSYIADKVHSVLMNDEALADV